LRRGLLRQKRQRQAGSRQSCEHHSSYLGIAWLVGLSWLAEPSR
jgi:hypothetical protein